MAITVVDVVGPPSGSQLIEDTAAGAAPAENIAQNKVVRSIYVDNSLNTAAVYLKLYDAATVTVGTTDPSLIIPVPASSHLSVTFVEQTFKFANLSWACVTTAGTGGTTAPSSPVTVRILVHD